MNADLKQKFDRERQNFPALERWVYLDHASGGLFPRYSTDAMKQYLEGMCENSMTFKEFTETWDFADEMRPEVAKMFHCQSSEIMYGLSSTWLFNIFINGIGLKPGDNIITTSNSHASVPYIMLNKRQDGVEVRFVHPKEGVTEPQDIFDLVDEHTRAICLCYVENTYGFKHNLKTYGEYCREHGIWFAVDATQAAGAMKIDVEEMKIDFLTTSSYKWLCCILGIGFAFISKRLQEQLKLTDTGWSCSEDRWHKDPEHPVLSKDARRFECGGISVVGLKGVSTIIRRYNELGAEDVQEYCLSLVDYLYSRVEKELTKAKVYGGFKQENRSSIVTLAVPEEWELTDEKAAQRGIRAHSPAKGLLRVGFHYYNNTEDVDRLVEFLKELEGEKNG